MRRLKKASKPRFRIFFLRIVYAVLIPLLNTVTSKLGINKLIQDYAEVELKLKTSDIKHSDGNKPLRIKKE